MNGEPLFFGKITLLSFIPEKLATAFGSESHHQAKVEEKIKIFENHLLKYDK
jgi:hypothetical protein